MHIVVLYLYTLYIAMFSLCVGMSQVFQDGVCICVCVFSLKHSDWLPQEDKVW